MYGRVFMSMEVCCLGEKLDSEGVCWFMLFFMVL